MEFDVWLGFLERAQDLVTEYSDSFNKSFHMEYGSLDPFINCRTENVSAKEVLWMNGYKMP